MDKYIKVRDEIVGVLIKHEISFDDAKSILCDTQIAIELTANHKIMHSKISLPINAYQDQDEWIVDLVNAGMSCRKVANKLDVSLARVQRVMNRAKKDANEPA